MSDAKRAPGRPKLEENAHTGPSMTIYFDDEDQRERFKAIAKKNKMHVRRYAESIIKAKADKGKEKR